MLNKFEFNVPPEDVGASYHGNFVLRFDQTQMEVNRRVYQIDEFFGAIAGLYNLFFAIFSIMFGKFVQLRGQLRWIKTFYRFKFQKEKIDKLDLE